MEALGAAGSIVGIVAFGLSLATVRHTHIESVSDAAERLRDITFEISSTASALKQLQDIINEDDKSDQSGERCVRIFKDQARNEILVVALQCEKLYTRIVVLVSKAGESGKDGKAPTPASLDLAALRVSGLGQKLKWPWLEPRIKGCQENLRWLKMNLLLNLQVASLASFQIRTPKRLPGSFEEELALRATLERLRKRRAEYVASKRNRLSKNLNSPKESLPLVPSGAGANTSSSSSPPSQIQNVDKSVPLVRTGDGQASDPLPNLTTATSRNAKEVEPQTNGKVFRLFPFKPLLKQLMSNPPSVKEVSSSKGASRPPPPSSPPPPANSDGPGLRIRPPPPLPPFGQRPAGPPPFRLPNLPEFGSAWVQDVTLRNVLGEADCTEKLTAYRVYTIQKESTENTQATWARVLVMQEALEEVEIAKQVKKLSKKSVFNKILALSKYQRAQVAKLIDCLKRGEQDPSFEWVLAQLDKKSKGLRYKSKKEAVIIVYAKRVLVRGINSILLHQMLERANMERLAQQYRPPPPPPQQQRYSAPITRVAGVKVARAQGGGRPPQVQHDASASSVSSCSSTSSSDNSLVNSHHPENRRSRYRSWSRRRGREHRKQYYHTERAVEAGNSSQKRENASNVYSRDSDELVSDFDIDDDEEEDVGLKIDFEKEDEEAKLSVDALLGRLTNANNDGVVETKEVHTGMKEEVS